MRYLTLVFSLSLATPAFAQSATIAIYASTAADPNTSTPITTPVVYTPVCPVSPKLVETPPLTGTVGDVANSEAYYDNPAGATTDCRVVFGGQINTLAAGSYKAAVKVGTNPFGPFSTAFSLSAAQAGDTCSPPDPTTGSVVAGTRTLTFCYPENATGGSPITGWALYVDGVRTLPTVTVGAVQTSGRRAYTLSVTVAVGSRQLQIAPINAIGEGTKSVMYALTALQPTTAPTGQPAIRSVN